MKNVVQPSFRMLFTRRKALLIGGAGAVATLSVAPSADAFRTEPCIEQVANGQLEYYLIAFGKDGAERPWAGELCIKIAIDQLRTQPVTDVFIFSHGWMGDIPQAKAQYNNWIAAMASCQSDIDAMRKVRPGFLPLLIVVHWPSLPLGDEEMRVATFAQGVAEQVGRFADRITDTPRSRWALQTIS